MTKYYHGSDKPFYPQVVLKGRGEQYVYDWKHTDFYQILEDNKPIKYLSHLKLFLWSIVWMILIMQVVVPNGV